MKTKISVKRYTKAEVVAALIWDKDYEAEDAREIVDVVKLTTNSKKYLNEAIFV